MIRFSNEKDIPQIISLWSEAFGDGEKEIRFFLDEWYKPQNTLVSELNGELASMLFLLEGSFCFEGAEYPAYYLYAACTAKKCRGKGLMGELLAFAERTAYERKYDFICLMPGEKSLFDFYSRFGYIPAFKTNYVSFSAEEYSFDGDAELENSAIDLSEMRNLFLSGNPYFKWSGKAIDFAFAQNKLYGGSSISTSKGYCLYFEEDSKTIVKEITFTSESMSSVIALLVKNSSSDKFLLRLPAWINLDFGKSDVRESAMLLPVTERAKEIAPNINNAYLGLTLD
ncbi:MAG: GNAT family N-acetyltransferase [Acutalibacteraceae bacterium]